MKIEMLELENFGPHERIKVEFDRSTIIGIIGPNGSGKSNLLAAILWLLTGVLEDDQATYIRDYAPGAKKEACLGRLRFSKGGKVGTITRRMTATSSSRELVWEDKTIKTAKEVDKVMGEIFGTGRGGLASSGCVRQGEMDKMFYGTISDRQDLFRKILNLGPIDPLSRKVATYVARLKSGLVDHRPQLATLQQQMLESDKLFADLRNQLLSYVNHTDRIQKLRRLGEHKSAVRRLEFLHKQRVEHHTNAVTNLNRMLAQYGMSLTDVQIHEKTIADTRERMRKLDADIASHARREAEAAKLAIRKKVLSDAQARRNTAAQLVEQREAEAAASPAANVAELRQAEKVRDLVARLRRAQADLPAKAAAATRPKLLLIPAQKRVAEFSEAYDKAFKDLSGDQAVLQIIAGAASADGCGCAACGNAAVDRAALQTRLAAYQQAVRDKTAIVNEASENLRKARAYFETSSAEATAAESALNSVKQDIASLTQQLDALSLPAGYVDTEAYTEIIARESKAEAARANATSELAAARKGLSDAEASLAEASMAYETAATVLHSIAVPELTKPELDAEKAVLQQTLDTSEAAIQELRPMIDLEKMTSAVADTAGKDVQTAATELMQLSSELGTLSKTDDDVALELATLEAEDASRTRIVGAIDSMTLTRTTAKAELERVERLVAENDERQQAVDKLKALETALGPNGAPGLYMQHVYETLLIHSAPTLSQMGAPFVIEPDKDEALSLKFRRLDSPTGEYMGQCKLSGGQRVLVTMAMLLAVQKLIMREVGFLALDEPSLHLSEEVVSDLRNTIVNLAETLEGTDNQLVIVDHHKALQTAFTNPIILGSCKRDSHE